MNLSRASFILSRNERLLPVALFLIFVLITIPGITWGLPSLWNPDELVWRVQKALGSELRFDEGEPDFNYPSLPKYVMYGIGKVTYGLGYSSLEFFTASRLASVLLGGVSVLLAYAIARQMGGNACVGTLAALFMMSCSTLGENARFAHNDLYLLFLHVTDGLFSGQIQTLREQALALLGVPVCGNGGFKQIYWRDSDYSCYCHLTGWQLGRIEKGFHQKL